MKTIELTQGKVAYVDDIDYDFLNQFSWCFDGKYAQTRSRGPMERMHELVAERKFGRKLIMVDHQNDLSLDNRRENLNESDKSRNGLNRKAKGYTETASGYRAQLRIKGVSILNKVFKTREEAINTYNTAKYKYLNGQS